MTPDEIAITLSVGRRFVFDELMQIIDERGIYAAWWIDQYAANDQASPCVYVGVAFNSLRRRLRSHFGGQRGGDQFCVYIWDAYVNLIEPRDGFALGKERSSAFNTENRTWIRERLCFSVLPIVETDSLLEIERRMKVILNPILNGAGSSTTESLSDPGKDGAD